MATAKPADLDPQDEVALLRRRLDRLSASGGSPAVARAIDQAQAVAQTGLDRGRENLDLAIGWIRDRPITAVLSAAGIGYVVGRLLR